jgi:hypothetical protein
MAAQPITLTGYLTELHGQGASILAESTTTSSSDISQLLQLDLDIKAWEDVLAGRPEITQLASARRELAFAIYAVSTGLYVHAFTGLRLFLELSFAAVYFSANELHRRRWVSDREDFSWSRALDKDEGVLAPAFVKEFSSSATEHSPVFAGHAATSYRHCSQFIHGKLAATSRLPSTLAFDGAVLADWLHHARQSALAVLYLLYARYGDEVMQDGNSPLASSVEHNFAHLESVRKRLGLPVESEQTNGN